MRAVNGTSRKRIWFYVEHELIQIFLETMVAVGCILVDIWHQNCSNHNFNKTFSII
jgi:hypothetical protein